MNGVHVLCPGEITHGVVEHSSAVARAAGVPCLTSGPPGPGDLAGAEVVHLGFTDRLYGGDATEAAGWVLAFGNRLRDAGVHWTVTLHDLPQTSDGPGTHERRRVAYLRIAEAADAVVVSTRHEAELLRRAGSAVEPTVIPLPIPDLAPRGPGYTPGWRPDRGAVVFGFLYPGKGHVEAVHALAHLSDPPAFLALGACSPGHEDLAGQLTDLGRALGVAVTVTGHVPRAELAGCLHGAAVPLAPHRHVSASGSIAAWIGAGRRPLVTRGAHALELLERWPGCVTPVAEDEWPKAIAAALADPASTWSDTPVRWGLTEVAAAHRAVWERVSR